MALTQVNIINLALSKIGDYLITAITDTSKQAIYSILHWENARDTLLRSFPWNFATEIAFLGTSGVYGLYSFSNYHDLPSDCLRVLAVSGTSDFDRTDTLQYKIKGTKILSNEDRICLKYIQANTTTSEYPPTFCNALAADLAIRLAESLSAAPEGKKQLLYAEYDQAITEARGVDFDEDYKEPIGYYSMIYCRDN